MNRREMLLATLGLAIGSPALGTIQNEELIPTGFEQLDKLLDGGFRPGYLYIIDSTLGKPNWTGDPLGLEFNNNFNNFLKTTREGKYPLHCKLKRDNRWISINIAAIYENSPYMISGRREYARKYNKAFILITPVKQLSDRNWYMADVVLRNSHFLAGCDVASRNYSIMTKVEVLKNRFGKKGVVLV